MREKATMRILAFLLPVALLLQSCGFTPLYATPEGSKAAGLKNINLTGVTARDTIHPLVTRAIRDRQGFDTSATSAEYDLAVEAEEFAQRLAVQIDASVTRYNYLLRADYVLIRRVDGKTYRGATEAVASFNVVNSQYSTLFAEEAAREKAARTLIENIERDILLRLDDDDAGRKAQEKRELPQIEFDNEYTRK